MEFSFADIKGIIFHVFVHVVHSEKLIVRLNPLAFQICNWCEC